jgi:hypothetical protein
VEQAPMAHPVPTVRQADHARQGGG